MLSPRPTGEPPALARPASLWPVFPRPVHPELRAMTDDPTALVISTEWPTPAVCVVHLFGELDGATVPRLARHLREQTEISPRDLVLDLSGVRLLAAAGLTLIVRARAGGLGIRGRLHLTGVAGNRQVEKVLSLTGVGAVVDIHHDLAALLATLTES